MDHDRKVCPRCGEPTAGYGFCAPCRAHIDSLTGGAVPRDEVTTAQVMREVVRLEQALADASNGANDRSSAGPSTAAVEVDPTPESLADGTTSAGLEIAKLSGTGDDAPQRPDVARLEDVLTVLSRPEDPGIAARTAAAAPPEVDDAPVDAAVTSGETASVPPPEATASVPPPEPALRPEPQLASPSYVAAHVLRAAFWFEQTSAFESRPDDEVIAEPIRAALPEIDPARHAATSVPPPVGSEAPSTPPPAPAEPRPAAEAETAQRHWITALCLLALVALVVVLTGRRPCRCDCHKSR
jgi:hypothetical protein